MMFVLRQRLLLVAGWITAAVVAGLVASGAVAVAGGQVLDRPLRPMTAAEVAALPVVEVGAPDDLEPHASGGFVSTTGGPTQGSDDAVGGQDDSAGTGGSSATPGSSSSDDPTVGFPEDLSRIISVDGGRASFSTSDGTLLLLWATPKAGYVAGTRSEADDRIVVAFSSSRGVWVIDATLSDGGIGIVTRPEPLA
jgi:hypothetical protein